jgi:hypothetical protein
MLGCRQVVRTSKRTEIWLCSNTALVVHKNRLASATNSETHSGKKKDGISLSALHYTSAPDPNSSVA